MVAMWIRHKNNQKETSDLKRLNAYQESYDLKLLSELYDSYVDLVYGVALKYLNDHSSAKDVVMEVYEHVAKKLRDHEVTNFKNWLHQVTKNHCLEKLRKKNRRKTDLVDHNEFRYMDLKTYDAEFEIDDGNSRIKRCMKKLTEKQRSCIHNFFYEDRTYKEIASLLEVTIDSVRSSIQNGKRNLKICMSKNQ